MLPKRPNILKFLSTVPEEQEDKILLGCFGTSIFSFLMIRVIGIMLYLRIRYGTCATVICPDLKERLFDDLPLSVRIMEFSRPLGAVLTLSIFEIVLLLINVRRQNARMFAFIGIALASAKLFSAIVEIGSNIDSAKFITTQVINLLNFSNCTFVLFESFSLYATVLAAYYRYRKQMNNHLGKEKKGKTQEDSEKSKKKDKDKDNEPSEKGRDTSSYTEDVS
uniref:Uncharacterized protein n=1 Tax=Parastrongyloides trichosuri TaxID=131310 RepID=A0A0N4ZW36_PARTI